MINIPDWLMLLRGLLIINSDVTFLILAFMVKCLLISLYCGLIYLIIHVTERIWGKRMSVRACYYRWYALLLSFPLSGLPFNNAIKLPFYDLFLGSFSYGEVSPENIDTIIQLTNIAYYILRPLLLLITLIWLVAVLIKLLLQIIVSIQLHKDIRRQPACDDPDGIRQQTAMALGLSPEKVQVIAVDFVRSPVSYGIFRKYILLPGDYNIRYSPQAQRLLLLHEMGHMKNRDPAKLQIISIAACFIWTLHFLKKHFIRDTEILCDNKVLGIGEDARDIYGELLVQECSAQKVVKGLAFSDSFHTIKRRLETIYSHKPEKHRTPLFAVAIALMLVSSGIYAACNRAEWLKTTGVDEPAYIEDNEFDVNVWYHDPDTNEMYAVSALELPLLMESREGETAGEQVEMSSEMLRNSREYQILRKTYHYADGQLLIDKIALYDYLLPYLDAGVPPTDIMEISFSRPSPMYIDTSRKSVLWDKTGGGSSTFWSYTLDIGEVAQASESNRYACFSCSLTFGDWVYLFAAHWL